MEEQGVYVEDIKEDKEATWLKYENSQVVFNLLYFEKYKQLLYLDIDYN